MPAHPAAPRHNAIFYYLYHFIIKAMNNEPVQVDVVLYDPLDPGMHVANTSIHGLR